jgi:kumamolisin
VPHGNRIELRLDRGSADAVWITPSTFHFRRVLNGPLHPSEEAAHEAGRRHTDDTGRRGAPALAADRGDHREAGLKLSVRRLDGTPLMIDLTEARSEAGGVAWERQAPEGAAFYGLGPRTDPAFDLRGKSVRAEVPFLVSTAGYGEYHPGPGTYHFDFTGPTAIAYRVRRSITTSITAPRRRRSSKSTTCTATSPNRGAWPSERFGSWATLKASLLRMVHGSMSAAIAPMFNLAAYNTAPPELQARARQLGSLVARVHAGTVGLSEFRQQLDTSSAATSRSCRTAASRCGIRCPCRSPTTRRRAPRRRIPAGRRDAGGAHLRTRRQAQRVSSARHLDQPGNQRSHPGTAHHRRGDQVAARLRAQRVHRAAGPRRAWRCTTSRNWAASSSCWRAISPSTRRCTPRPALDIMRLEIESKKDRDYQWVVHHVERPVERGVRGSPVPGSGGAWRAGRPHVVLRCGAEERARPREGEGRRGLHHQSELRVLGRPPIPRDEFAALYGADPADVERIEQFASQYDLTVGQIDLARRSIAVAGKVADMNEAFGTELRLFQSPDGTYRGRIGELSVPNYLGDVVVGVFGLDARPQAKVRSRRHVEGVGPRAAGDTSYTPPAVARLYSFPAGSGSGQTVAIVELGGGYTAADLSAYFAALKVSPAPSVTAVSVDGASNLPVGNPNSADGEVLLDIEVVGAIAPQAKIAVYFAPNTDQGFLDAITTAVHDNLRKPSVVSISWGGAESTWTAQSLTAYDQAFQDAGLLGVTVCCASGDDGSADSVTDGAAHVDFPASSPNVLACGGTRLESSGGKISREVVWNQGAGKWRQRGRRQRSFPAACLPGRRQGAGIGQPAHFKGRGVPDISGDADPATGYQIHVDGKDAVFGGTSAVAPLWAALIALINQQLGKPVGFLNTRSMPKGRAGCAISPVEPTAPIRPAPDGMPAPVWAVPAARRC